MNSKNHLEIWGLGVWVCECVVFRCVQVKCKSGVGTHGLCEFHVGFFLSFCLAVRVMQVHRVHLWFFFYWLRLDRIRCGGEYISAFISFSISQYLDSLISAFSAFSLSGPTWVAIERHCHTDRPTQNTHTHTLISLVGWRWIYSSLFWMTNECACGVSECLLFIIWNEINLF